MGPAPDRRLRGAFPHLSCSSTSLAVGVFAAHVVVQFEKRPSRGTRRESGNASQEAIKAIERLRDGLHEIKKRWDNRLILEKTPLWEGYLDGRFEIVMYGNWFSSVNDSLFACRVKPRGNICDPSDAEAYVNILNANDGR